MELNIFMVTQSTIEDVFKLWNDQIKNNPDGFYDTRHTDHDAKAQAEYFIELLRELNTKENEITDETN